MARLTSNLTKLAVDVPEAASRALLQTAADIYEISQQLVPVDTSSLKRSGGVEVIDSNTVQVGYGSEGVFIGGREPSKYAIPVEYGSEHSSAQPYLTPAFAQSTETFKVRLLQEVEKAAG